MTSREQQATFNHPTALRRPHVEPMDFTGNILKSMAFIRPKGIRTPAQLKAWVKKAAEFAATLPPKKSGGNRRIKKAAKTVYPSGPDASMSAHRRVSRSPLDCRV